MDNTKALLKWVAVHHEIFIAMQQELQPYEVLSTYNYCLQLFLMYTTCTTAELLADIGAYCAQMERALRAEPSEPKDFC